MNAVTDTQITEVQKIERALDALISTAITAKPPWPAEEQGRPRIYTLKELIDGPHGQSPASRAAYAFYANPVGEAVRAAVTTLGERLHEIGGLQLMQDVCDRVADRDPERWGWRTDIMDKRWDGIGRTATSAGWCC